MTPYTSAELRLFRVLLAGIPGDTDYPVPGHFLPEDVNRPITGLLTVDIPRLRTKLDIHLQRELSRELQNKKGSS